MRLTQDTLGLDLVDGRTIIGPLVSDSLLSAGVEQRSNWKVASAGYEIYWPDLDEDLGTDGFHGGAPGAAEPGEVRR